MSETTKTPAEIAASLTPAQRRDLLEISRLNDVHPTWTVPWTPACRGLVVAGCMISDSSTVALTDLGRAVAAELTRGDDNA